MQRKQWWYGLLLIFIAGGVVGPAGAASSPTGPKLPSVPAVQGTVKDLCTGAAVPGFSVQLVDPSGGSLPPTSMGTTAFSFGAVSEPSYELHIEAPGYQPLGDAVAGVPLDMPPGVQGTDPVQVEKNPGPVGTQASAFLRQGLRVAAMLMPAAGCPGAPRTPTLPAISGKVVDVSSGKAIAGTTCEVVGANPGPTQVPVDNGKFLVDTWEDAQAIDINCEGDAAHEPASVSLFHTGALPLGSGKATVGESVAIGLFQAVNHDPVIVSTALSATEIESGDTVTLNQVSFDPDVKDNLFLQIAWTANGATATCTFNPVPPHGFSTDVTCIGHGTVTLKLRVADLRGGATEKLHLLTVVPPGP
jgi:hypothetical protein